jgi:3-deoxy-D-manno-octulosonic-acid transferase
MTPTGRATSEALFGDSVERIYLPYDTPWAMRRFLRHFRPQFGLIMETELWPNLIAACRRAGLPLLLVNARLSDRSARRYAKFPALTREALQSMAAIGAQTGNDAARLAALGAQNVTVSGNISSTLPQRPSNWSLAANCAAAAATDRCGWPPAHARARKR